jgi:hypothetical protein
MLRQTSVLDELRQAREIAEKLRDEYQEVNKKYSNLVGRFCKKVELPWETEAKEILDDET